MGGKLVSMLAMLCPAVSEIASALQYDASGQLWALGRSQSARPAHLKLGLAARSSTEEVVFHLHVQVGMSKSTEQPTPCSRPQACSRAGTLFRICRPGTYGEGAVFLCRITQQWEMTMYRSR